MTKFLNSNGIEKPKNNFTVFFLCLENGTWKDTESMPTDYDKVICLGRENNNNIMCLFACYKEGEEQVRIYKGAAGDEFK